MARGSFVRVSALGLLLLAAIAAGSANSWNLTMAERLVHFSAAAYCPIESVLAWNCAPCTYFPDFVPTKFIQNTKTWTNAFVGYSVSAQQIIISFEGTANLTNWITDLRFFKLDFDYPGASGARVHRGFLYAYESVGLDVEADVGALVAQFPTFQVFVTGHSLGGALALFGALDITVKLPHVPVQVYTFGEPRVGNAAFSDYYNSVVSNSIRVVNKEDIVPHLPLETMGFYHELAEVWINNDNDIVVCELKGEHNGCSPFGYSVADHKDYLGTTMGQSGC